MLKNTQNRAENSELGKKTSYSPFYNKDLLFAIPRAEKRLEIGIDLNKPLAFVGFDLWNHYEVSWLNEKGKPIVALAEIIYPCHSPHIIESKSMKLYFNSLNNTKFKDITLVTETIKNDLQEKVGAKVTLTLTQLHSYAIEIVNPKFIGICIDDLEIECNQYLVNPNLLKTCAEEIENEILFSNLLKSNCLITNQPDWGSIFIQYSGKRIDQKSLLKYLISFRNHNEFHEQCIERIYMDILNFCFPTQLTVYGKYTRRGGIDINPYRTSNENNVTIPNIRLIRQ